MLDDDGLIDRLKARIRSATEAGSTGPNQRPFVFHPPAPRETVADTEAKLGFALPQLLFRIYCEVANGGFGPGLGVIGVRGGYACDYGDLAETYALYSSGHDTAGNKWPVGMLPFCAWGCAICSCVNCNDLRVSSVEDGRLWPQSYSLHDFLEMWLEDVDILSQDPQYEIVEMEITNPFTGKKATMRTRRRRIRP